MTPLNNGDVTNGAVELSPVLLISCVPLSELDVDDAVVLLTAPVVLGSAAVSSRGTPSTTAAAAAREDSFGSDLMCLLPGPLDTMSPAV